MSASPPFTGAIEGAVVIAAPAARIVPAFFEHEALVAWWHVRRSVVTPKVLGAFAVEWEPTDWRDDVLGRLGGAMHGTIMEFRAEREIFVAEVHYLPPDGEAIGPMAITITFTPHAGGTMVRVRQSGYEEGARWRRYYEVMHTGWQRALETLKDYVENQWLYRLKK